MDEADFHELLDQFRQELHDCRELYRSSGQICVEAHVPLAAGSEQDLVSWMDDLHKALLIKIFITICEADRRWSRNEQRLAQELFLHTWGRQLEGESLREAVRHIARRSLDLKWYSLIRPFDQIALLRDRIGQLETVTMRLANTIARADGQLSPATATYVRHVANELRRHLRPIPVDEPSQHAEADALGPVAIRRVEKEASKARTQCQLTEATPPEATRAPPHERLADALGELDGLLGLAGVKSEVHTLANFLKVQQQRQRAGLPQTNVSLHTVFHGNPGTGKTTVARIVAKIYGAMGILDKGHLIETDRSGLVAQYAGQTAVKTNKKVDEALGGVLFIDEAYSLIAEGGDDPYGHEAVQALLKRMEDDRERLVVILAGYPAPMARLLGSNPGLSSRFGRHLTFADYTPCELGQIFHRMCTKNQYVIPPSARAKLLLGLQWLYNHRDEHFGNGRTVRNVFELSIRRLANRIADISRLSKEQLTVLDTDDIMLTGVPREELDDLTRLRPQFRITCPDCGSQCPVPQDYLGRRVKCNSCQREFAAEWGEPVLAESGTAQEEPR